MLGAACVHVGRTDKQTPGGSRRRRRQRHSQRGGRKSYRSKLCHPLGRVNEHTLQSLGGRHCNGVSTRFEFKHTLPSLLAGPSCCPSSQATAHSLRSTRTASRTCRTLSRTPPRMPPHGEEYKRESLLVQVCGIDVSEATSSCARSHQLVPGFRSCSCSTRPRVGLLAVAVRAVL